ncbi:retrovirus-related pol polyprotein from transposon TNT 1-94 [Tanacetum coccineum]|uniref:Retrovirus-related pol polyprotein from transposon TNT 1-94 n=1 Tax=Tanacetum coccineum TaxID=301880 RepID=A0ABQ5GA37_9ASTR
MVNRDVIVDEACEWDWEKSVEPAVVEQGKPTSIVELTNNGINTSNDLPISDDEAEPRNQRTRTLKELYDSTGEVYKQKVGIDYDQVFAPITRIKTIRLFIAQAAQFKWPILQMDVKSAFLNGILEEDVYVEQPPGYMKARNEKKVLKLKKALYGLKQAPRA